MTDKTKDLFVGSKKIKSFQEFEDLKEVAVLYEDGSNDHLKQEQFDSMIANEVYPDIDVSVRKFTPLAKICLEAFLEYDVRLVDKDFVLNLIDTSIIQNYQSVIAKVFGITDSRLVPLSLLDQYLTHNFEVKFEE